MDMYFVHFPPFKACFLSLVSQRSKEGSKSSTIKANQRKQENAFHRPIYSCPNTAAIWLPCSGHNRQGGIYFIQCNSLM